MKTTIVEPARITISCFNDIEAIPINWLWDKRIATGKLTIIAGDPGLGKSLTTISLAANVTTGKPFPVSKTGCGVGSVLFLSAEDDPADTIKPRLLAAGADVSKVYTLGLVEFTDNDGKHHRRGFDLARDLELLEKRLTELKDCRLVIIDPISAYLGSTDSHNNSDIRGLLAPLGEMATKHKVAIVAVTHLNKGGSGNAIYRTTGSLAFVAAARASFLVTKDEDDNTRRLFIPAKNNLGDDGTGFAYRVGVMGEDIAAPYVIWEEDLIEISADEALAGGAAKTPRRDAAAGFLRELLSGGAVNTTAIEEAADAGGHKWRTVERAKKELGVVSYKDEYQGNSFWCFTQHQPTPPNTNERQTVETPLGGDSKHSETVTPQGIHPDNTPENTSDRHDIWPQAELEMTSIDTVFDTKKGDVKDANV